MKLIRLRWPLGHVSLTLVILISGFLAPDLLARSGNSLQVNVRLVADEAEAVLAIMVKKRSQQTPTDADWQRVFQSEGYVRLKQRETSMQRSFDDADFRAFVLSDQLAERAQALEETLSRWKQADISRAARLALAYLPKDTRITAKIYPVIKPRENSFVFDVKDDPAIFLYLDPTVSREKFENTLAHELHHIGYSSSCPSKHTSDEIAKLPANAQAVLKWIGAFGEGFAMLAAAGGPDVHPHAVSGPKERARWDGDVANFNDDLKKVEKFYLDIFGKPDDQRGRAKDGIFILRRARPVVHGGLEDGVGDRKDLRAGNADRMHLRPAEIAGNLQQGGHRI